MLSPFPLVRLSLFYSLLFSLSMAYCRKWKFYSNQFTLRKKQKAEEVAPSQSTEKLAGATYDVQPKAPSVVEGYRLIDVALLADFLSEHLVCRKCHGRIQMTDDGSKRKGERDCATTRSTSIVLVTKTCLKSESHK